MFRKLLILLSFYVVILFTIQDPQPFSNTGLWNKYRTQLLYSLAQKYFCGGKTDCNALKGTGAQIVTEPLSVNSQISDNSVLTNIFKYAPKFGLDWKPNTVGYDGEIQKLYETLLLNHPNKDVAVQKFVEFHKFVTEHAQDLWKEIENGAIKKFIEESKNKNFNPLFTFNVNSQESVHNAWTDLGERMVNYAKGFMRKVLTNNQEKNLYKKLSDKTVYHTVYQKKIVIQKGNKFDMTLTAKNFKLIDVHPSSKWFDYDFIKKNKEILDKLGYTGHNGKFPLLPKSILVAYQPKVQIKLSKSQYENIKNDFESGNALGFLVGGTSYKTNAAVKSLSDTGAEFYIPGEKREQADEVIFKPPKSKIYKMKKILEKNKMKKEEELEKHLNDIALENQIALNGGRRRRVRHVTITKIQYVNQYEGDYIIEFISHSEKPQMLAVVSDVL